MTFILTRAGALATTSTARAASAIRVRRIIAIGRISIQLLDEEFARKRNVRRNVGMHRVLAEHINPELGPGFRKVPLAIEHDDVGIEPATFAPVRHFEETAGELYLM